MPLNDDGDLIRGLGFVTLYAAYLEEAVDECLQCLLPKNHVQYGRVLRRPTSGKVDYISNRMKDLGPLPQELVNFPQMLNAVSALLERRNVVVHGRVYAIPGVGDIRKPSRGGMSEEVATSAELYTLANRLFAACNPLQHASMSALPRLLRAIQSEGQITPMSVQRDFAKEHDEALKEYETAKEAYFNLSGAVTSRFAAVYGGHHEANPSLDLLEAADEAKERWEVAKGRLHDIAVEWARTS